MIDLSLLEDFVMGAGESLEEMETALLALESTPNDNELLNTIFRAIHTIKGAAQFVGLERTSALSHALEDLLDLLRDGKKQATLEIIDVLIQAKDRINLLVTDLERSQTEETEVNDLIAKLNVYLGIETVDEPTITDTDTNISSFLPEDNESEIEELGLFLSEEETDENISSFLSEEETSEDVSSFLSEEEEAGEDVSSFLSEEEETDEDVSSFLSEEEETDEDVSSFLPEEDTETNLASFLLEEIEDNNKDSIHLDDEFLSSPLTETKKDNSALILNTDEVFILPDEEYDQELFGIFILQLQEKFTVLKTCAAQLKTSNYKKELLANILEALESLKFSANYMVYEDLTHFYGGWINKVLDSQEKLTITGDISLAFIVNYLDQLQTIFPQLKNIEAKDNTIEQKLSDALTLNTLNVNNEPQEDPVFVKNLELKNKTLNNSANFEKKTAIAESDLFDKLSSALDASIIEQSITSEPINEVFGALLDSTEKQRKQPKTSKDNKLTIDVKTLAEANKESPKTLDKIEKPIINAETIINAKVEKIEKPVIVNQEIKNPKTTTKAAPGKVLKKSIRVDADKIDSLMNQVGELIVDRAYFFQLAIEISELQQYLKETGLGQKDLKPVRTFAYRFSEAIISLGRTSNELQEGVMKIRMLPMAQIFNRFPRLVHDVANTNNKKVTLNIKGEETELDKMIIEEIADPLMHMIRNAIGHGIEIPEDRIKLGKPEIGSLTLEAYNESNHIVIEVTDDGRGIDIDRVKVKAEQMELFSREELDRMTDNDLTRFIMMPGFSTAKEVSSTSGRGVGMDVVKKNIEKLNGTIDVESKKGVGTKMRLKIPLTLAIIPALLVKVGIDSFTIPLANVEETLRVEENEVSIMEDTEVMYLRGKTVPIFRLATLFSLKSDNKIGSGDFFVVIVNTGSQKIGLMVDSLIGQEEVVIKPLADYLHEQNCFSGATIIGDGRISLILDIYELINMTTDKQIKKHRRQERNTLENEI